MTQHTTHSPADIDAWIDSIDPSTLRDGKYFRDIIAAKEAKARATQDLLNAVIAARAAGDSWVLVGAALDITRQAAEQRFGPAVRAALASQQKTA